MLGGGAKLLCKTVSLKGAEITEKPFERLAGEFPFQTFKIHRSKTGN
ncbi:MAG: hypothetical protein LBU32_17955 [Clostridiales bacterium]|nr:hypothetical protein [Clostridiales bacterium]